MITFTLGSLLLAVWLVALLGFGLGWFLAVRLYVVPRDKITEEATREFLRRRRENAERTAAETVDLDEVWRYQNERNAAPRRRLS